MFDFANKFCPKEKWYDALFSYGLKDVGKCMPAMSCDIADPESQAQVTASTETRFQPLDHCQIYSAAFSTGKRCDGIVVSRDFTALCFVELKDRRSKWFEEASAQLENTINVFKSEAPSLLTFAKIRRAYIANRKASQQPNMSPSMASRQERFLKLTGFLLRISVHIKILNENA